MNETDTIKFENYGINGYIVNVSFVKKRTIHNRRFIPLIFNKRLGSFDFIMSLFQLLENEGKVNRTGSKLYFDGCPDIKFSLEEFKNVLESSPELQREFAIQCRDTLDNLLSDNQSVIKPSFDIMTDKSSKDNAAIFNELDSLSNRLDVMEQTIFRVIYAITANN